MDAGRSLEMVYHVPTNDQWRDRSIMRKTVAAALALALALVALAMSGCGLFGSPLDDANAAIEAANVHLRKYQESEDRVQKLATDLNTMNAVTAEEATGALVLVADLKKELSLERTALQAASKEIAKVKTFKVDDTFKKYADLEIAAINAQIAVVDEGEKLYNEMERHYVSIRDGKSTTTLANEILTNIDTISANITKLSETAAKAKDAADKYFDDTADEK